MTECAITQEQLDKLDRLGDIVDHVLGITTKIAEMDDPLPDQLQRSVPDYLGSLTSQATSLRDRHWPFIIAGDTMHSKLYVASQLCGHDLCSALPETCNLPTLVSYSDRQHAQVVHTNTEEQPMVIENWEGIHEYVEKAIADSGNTDQSKIRRVELLLNKELLKDGLDLLVIPSHIRSDDFVSTMGSFLTNYFGMLYVVDVSANSVPTTIGLHHFLRELVKYSSSNDHPIGTSSCIVVCLFQPSQATDAPNSPEEKEGAIMHAIKECWPACEDSQIIIVSKRVGDETQTQDPISRLQFIMYTVLAKAVESKVNITFNWLSNFVGRVIHHLRAFLSQCEKSHAERLQTFSEIQCRLVQLTKEADDFFKVLKKEMDSKVHDAQTLLKLHLTDEMVLHRLSTWIEEDIPDEQMWHDIDHIIHTKILARIRAELLSWEETNNFFHSVQPLFIQNFEQKFSGIESQIVTVEAMIARHDSRVCLTDIVENQGVKDEQSIGFLPSNLNLKWQQKVLLGVAAPFLLPIALTLMVVGLPILGGMAAKDLISEKLSESKLREYNENKAEFMRKRTCEEVHHFVKSKYVEQFVKSQLRPAYRCIHQMQEIIPRQIEADKMQIESLRLDERDAKDVARFYLPLVEIFEHDKQLLSLFRVFHMHRDKISIPTTEIKIPDTGHIVCDGFRGTIQTGFWSSPSQTKVVSVKEIRERVDVKVIDEYLLEENACRFQASVNIVKFLGVTLINQQLHHVLGPLKCNLRQVLAHSPEVTPEARDSMKYGYLKQKMVQVVRGLDYLHERGWVHFDLSLDTIAADAHGCVKLTNISCRKIFRVPRNLPRGEVYRYSHLPPEVLLDPPAAYTSVSEMYSVGIMMWEMWTGTRAYWERISNPKTPIDTIDKFAKYVEDGRPNLGTFYADDSSESDSKKEPTSPEAGRWCTQMQHCWCESERLSTKGFLQVMDEAYAANFLPFKEYHFK